MWFISGLMSSHKKAQKAQERVILLCLLCLFVANNN
jgi:hypothetical protein